MRAHVYDIEGVLLVDLEDEHGNILANVETCDHRDEAEIRTATEIAGRKL